jgi:hypothetical protein
MRRVLSTIKRNSAIYSILSSDLGEPDILRGVVYLLVRAASFCEIALREKISEKKRSSTLTVCFGACHYNSWLGDHWFHSRVRPVRSPGLEVSLGEAINSLSSWLTPLTQLYSRATLPHEFDGR